MSRVSGTILVCVCVLVCAASEKDRSKMAESVAKSKVGTLKGGFAVKAANEMRPREIITARERSGCAFIPISPTFEWHSYHLPMGCDGIIAESIAKLMAEKVGGIYFPILSFGLDTIRPEGDLIQWGFKPTDNVFGMNFPELPLVSEYAEKPEMLESLLNRVDAVRRCGFTNIFIINHHGGKGQYPELEKFAKENTSEKCKIHFVGTSRFITLKNARYLSHGGHAGLAETMMLMAFRPDLIDLSQIPDGELSVREYGILHNKPTIESEWNPRHAVKTVADDLRKNLVENFYNFVQEQRREK